MTVEERIQLQREQRLIQLGYSTKVYMPLEEDSTVDPAEGVRQEDYPYFDEETQQYFRYEALEVTDEQFQRILAIGGEHVAHSRNRLASALTFLAWLGCLLGVLLGFLTATTGPRSAFNFTVFFTWSGVGAGCLFSLLWFAEVLKLLQRIHDKL